MSGEPIGGNDIDAGRFRSAAATHTSAARRRNEDSFVNRPDLGLWAVADGAGGHQAGDVASRLLAEALEAVPAGLGAAEILAEVRLRAAQAHRRMQEEAARLGAGAQLISTLVVLLAHGEHYACLWAGDSRAYLLRDGVFRQVTHDHSLVQQLVDAGTIEPAEAEHHPRGNIITRAIGGDSEPAELEKVSDRLQRGDLFLLCSDGLSKTLPAAELAEMLAAGGDTARSLVAAALDRQADDNVTAVTVAVAGDDAPVASGG